MSRSTRIFWFLCVLTLVAGAAVAGKQAPASVFETDAYQVPGKFDYQAFLAEQDASYALLVGSSQRKRGSYHVAVDPGAADFDRMNEGGCQSCGSNAQSDVVGVSLPFGHPFDLSDMGVLAKRGDADLAGGDLTATESAVVWELAVTSAGAGAVRLHLAYLQLPAGAELFFYNDRGEVDGPYRGQGPNRNGNLWSAPLTGDTVTVQVRAPYGFEGKLRFKLADVVWLKPEFVVPGGLDENAKREFCSQNVDCIESAACHNPSAVSAARNAIALIAYVNNGRAYTCSGGLINGSGGGAGRPYFLTAQHCINNSAAAESIAFFWQYATDDCGDPCFSRSQAARTNGATLLTADSSEDYSLLLCNQTPPAGSRYLGVSTGNIGSGVTLHRISHPRGAPQAYSRTVSTTGGSHCSARPRSRYIYSYNLVGSTEGGSSGAPVLNSSGRVVGQLYGYCSPTSENGDPCSANYRVLDGRLSNWRDNLEIWLRMGTPACNGCGSTYSGCSLSCYWDCDVDGRCDEQECEEYCDNEYDACRQFCR